MAKHYLYFLGYQPGQGKPEDRIAVAAGQRGWLLAEMEQRFGYDLEELAPVEPYPRAPPR